MTMKDDDLKAAEGWLDRTARGYRPPAELSIPRAK